MESSNPFYAPPAIPDLSPQIMQFGEMGIRNDQLAAQRAMEMQKINNEKSYQDTMGAAATQRAAAQTAKVQAQTPPSRQDWNQDQFDKLKTNMAMKGLPVDSLDAVLTPISQMANNPAMKRGDVANAIQQNWSNPVDPADPSKGTTGFQTDLNNGLQTKIMSLAQKAAGLQDNDPQKQPLMDQINKLQNIKAQFNQITPDNVKQAFFPDVAQEEANTKAALLTAKNESRRPIIAPAGSVVLDADGKFVFKNPLPNASAKASRETQQSEIVPRRTISGQ
jgi:hypothetical protein